jgi:DNA (cytosine-5)-methyltransferase 1
MSKDTNRDIQNTPSNIDNEGLSWVQKAFSHPNRIIRLATSFSGIGAIEYAFKRLGLNSKIVFAGDIDANCKKTYFANYDIKEEQWHTDIHNFNAKPYRGKVDLFVGGAPCQAFSIVGDQRGFEDTRGTLFREFARVVKECQPKVFIFENVQGLFKHDHGRTWEVIYNTFVDYCGYDVHYQLLNARDYGIPQTRERLYCIGFRRKTNFKYPAPIPLKYRMYDFLEDYQDTEYYDETRKVKILTADDEHRKELLENLDNERFNDFVFHIHEVEDKYYLSEKVGKYVLCSGTKTFKTPIKTDLDIARPLLQSMHKMHRAGVDNYVSYNKAKGIDGLRKLTPRECLRLMGFKDDFQIVVSNTPAYMQAGNSIVVDVLIALLKQLDISKYGVDYEE